MEPTLPLSPDLHIYLYQFFDVSTLFKLSLVNKFSNTIAQDDYIWGEE